jgi:hypothetical protein
MTEPTEVPALATILRRYAFAYTASNDPSVCADIMVEDYTLRMGDFAATGRDDNYIPAAVKQLRQFPGLGMSVHQLLITPDRAALQFSEYGRSLLTDNDAAWSGISMYHWNGVDRLVDCRVEQDYYSRRRQQKSGVPSDVDRPAHDPWAHPIETPDPAVEIATRDWLLGNGIASLPVGSLDDEIVYEADRVVLDSPEIEILDCFAGQSRSAFHACATGVISGWPGAADGVIGKRSSVYYAGIAHVADGQVTSARVISDRLATERRALKS